MEKLTVLFFLLFTSASGTDSSKNRIVGGQTAPEGAYPYQVSLRTNYNKHFCGGSIISPDWILTAAHCIKRRNTADIIVVAGTNTLSSGGVMYHVAGIYNHEEFSIQTKQHDISLLRLENSIKYTGLIRPIPLNEVPVQGSTLCVLSGWGLTTYPSKDIPDKLQHIFLHSIKTEDCESAMINNQIFHTQMCTGSAPGYGACRGDSGGPLVAAGIQVGIVSWGAPCAKGAPDVFTDVAAYRTWIKNTSGI